MMQIQAPTKRNVVNSTCRKCFFIALLYACRNSIAPKRFSPKSKKALIPAIKTLLDLEIASIAKALRRWAKFRKVDSLHEKCRSVVKKWKDPEEKPLEDWDKLRGDIKKERKKGGYGVMME